MNAQEFARQLRTDGFDEVLSKSLPGGSDVGPHSHPFAVKALVTEGDITLGVAGHKTTYHAGDIFTLARDCEHTECSGATGVQFIVGRKHG